MDILITRNRVWVAIVAVSLALAAYASDLTFVFAGALCASIIFMSRRGSALMIFWVNAALLATRVIDGAVTWHAYVDLVAICLGAFLYAEARD